MWRRMGIVILGLSLFLGAGGIARASQPLIAAADWQAYKGRFLDVSGRIVDDGNGRISHSEGQGYGLLLAYLAGSPADFEQIWYFTRTELLVRDDGLAAWHWDPDKRPHVTDVNNASDGDILIAYALALAGVAWARPDYTAEAAKIARSLLDKAVVEKDGMTLLLPGVSGFSATDRPDGPVINPSYWVFEAFPVLDTVAPSPKWRQLSDSGVALLKRMQFGPRRLPAEWVAMTPEMRAAQGFPPEFGYNALRIPLYLMRGGIADRELLTRLRAGMGDDAGSVVLANLATGAVTATLQDPGYQIINHLVACVTEGRKLPASVRQFSPTLYYPSTLHLLGLAFAAEKHPECL